MVRGGERIGIDGEQLVPGGIVLLEAGDKVPADLRLLAAHGMSMQEAVLTGESDPVEKHTGPVAIDAALATAHAWLFPEHWSPAARAGASWWRPAPNFASIVAAVREGRTVYDNIKKVISWTLPTNAGEALTIVVALLFGLTLPVTPVQILWINLITAITPAPCFTGIEAERC